jgi:Na+/H+ antiporter NhaD/arsenite permease-like protein
VTDLLLYRKDGRPEPAPRQPARLTIEGAFNLLLIAGVVGAVLMSGLWDPGIEYDILGAHLPLQNLVRDAVLVALALASLPLTPQAIRKHNAFHWAPIVGSRRSSPASSSRSFP